MLFFRQKRLQTFANSIKIIIVFCFISERRRQGELENPTSDLLKE